MQRRVLSGFELFSAFSSGGLEVIRQKTYLNSINVFPVPDGDTGSNLSSTMQSILENTNVSHSAGRTIHSMAEAALSGARGNSGIIFAQFLNGLSERLRGLHSVTMEEFSGAVSNAAQRAYEAINNPVEGTMLTVMREWAETVSRIHHRAESFADLFHSSIHGATESLKKTPERLKVLKTAKVTDAGAEGFVDFLRGIIEFFRTGKPVEYTPGVQPDTETEPHNFSAESEIVERYCSEALLAGEDLQAEDIRRDIAELGDSLIVAGGGSRVRIHIHTNSPTEVFGRLARRGKIVQQKVDDMRRQFETVHRRKYPIALVTDSACDLPAEVIDRYQIHVIPTNLSFGDDHYIDRLTISPSTFYTMMRERPELPGTSQPAPASFNRLYDFLSQHYESVVAVNLSSPLSGTWSTSAAEAAKVAEKRGKKISVVDSRHASASEGLVVLRAAEAIAAGKTHEEVVETAERAARSTRNFVAVRTLKYLIRSGRVGRLKGRIGSLLGLTPLVTITPEGKTTLSGVFLSQRASLKHIRSLIKRNDKKTPVLYYALAHANARECAEETAKELSAALGRPPEFIVDAAPVLGLHAGEGTVSVVITCR